MSLPTGSLRWTLRLILLGGGTKAQQDADIKATHARWRDYKQRKEK
jgi:hypothetical protein